jgi:hypothetical protein
MSSKRKYERQKKKLAEKEIKEKIGLFDKLPEKCLTCDSEFDRLNKEMVAEWRVVVDKKESKVRLYCPECWETAVNIVKEYNERGVKS